MKAMIEKIQSLFKNRTWDPSKLLKGEKIFRCNGSSKRNCITKKGQKIKADLVVK